jgi:translation initiation factor 4E
MYVHAVIASSACLQSATAKEISPNSKPSCRYITHDLVAIHILRHRCNGIKEAAFSTTEKIDPRQRQKQYPGT